MSVVSITDPILGKPSTIEVIGDAIVITDIKPPFVHVFDRHSLEHIRSFGDRGEGPGMFRGSPKILKPSRSDSAFLMFDPPGRRLSRIPIDAIDPDPERVFPVVKQTYSLTTMLLSAVDGSIGSGIVASSLDPDSGLVIVTIGTLGDSGSVASRRVDIYDEGLGTNFVHSAYNPRVCVSPDGKLAAFVYHFAGRIDLFEVDHLTSTPADVPHVFEPQVSFIERIRADAFSPSADDTRRAYSSCVATNEGLFAAYDGELRSNPPFSKDLRPNTEIHEFDWSGRLRRVMVLDHFTLAFDVIETTGTFLTISFETEGPVVRTTKYR